MSPRLFALQTDFDTIWLNCTEKQIELLFIFILEMLYWPGRVCM